MPVAHEQLAQAAINSKADKAASTAAIAHPSVKFMLQHPAHMIALGFGSGLPRIAPGTVGTLWAWLAYLVLQLYLDKTQIGWLIAARPGPISTIRCPACGLMASTIPSMMPRSDRKC